MIMRGRGARRKVRIPGVDPGNKKLYIASCIKAVNAVDGQIKRASLEMSGSAASLIVEAKKRDNEGCKADHFMGQAKLTELCNERKYNKKSIKSGDVEGLGVGQFVYESNIMYNLDMKRMSHINMNNASNFYRKFQNIPECKSMLDHKPTFLLLNHSTQCNYLMKLRYFHNLLIHTYN